MNVNKRNFLKAGAIIAIVSAVFMLFTGLSFATSVNLINEETILNTITYGSDYQKFQNSDGSYYIEFFEDEGDLRPEKLEQKDIQDIVKIAKGVLITLSIIVFGVATVQFVFGTKILKNIKKDISKKSHIITLLVFSILTNSMLTMAFMIVALCIKDKKVTLENINEIALKNEINSQQNEESKEE